jgi:hypothetical protein
MSTGPILPEGVHLESCKFCGKTPDYYPPINENSPHVSLASHLYECPGRINTFTTKKDGDGQAKKSSFRIASSRHNSSGTASHNWVSGITEELARNRWNESNSLTKRVEMAISRTVFGGQLVVTVGELSHFENAVITYDRKDIVLAIKQ